ncbi:MAG: hypothetical protein ACOX7M_10775, partial [Dysosmobacter sp.]|uniref:hypothetical protein n=1 Tax=Dysosmobacter sp. TaxID=2591382 RepID=UPI003D8B9316
NVYSLEYAKKPQVVFERETICLSYKNKRGGDRFTVADFSVKVLPCKAGEKHVKCFTCRGWPGRPVNDRRMEL